MRIKEARKAAGKTLCYLLVSIGLLQGSAHSQVLLSWDSVLNTTGVVVTRNTPTTYNLVSGVTYEIGYWINSVDLTSKTTILSGFTPLGAGYSGTVVDGYFSGANDSAVIPGGWAGISGSTFGIVFGRSSEIWGAFRFDQYAGGSIKANSAPPASPNQMDGFEIAQISASGVYLPSSVTSGAGGKTGADFIETALSIPLTQFGDTDTETPGNQYLTATYGAILIPEPSTVSLLAMASLLLFKRRKAASV